MADGFYKDVSGLVHLAGGLEMPLEKQQGLITPNADFFICHDAPTPIIAEEGWSLSVEGDAVTNPLSLSRADLEAMEQVTLPVLIECAGNHRQLFEDVMGEPLNRRPHLVELRWHLGGLGMAEWQGVRLADVLTMAGITDEAYHVMPVGLDRGREGEDGIRMPMPATKAMHPDTLIALRMNGETLPPDHGFPARTIVPGWVGTYSVKWLDRIEVTREHRWVERNTERYVLMGEAWDANDYAPAKGPLITKHPLRSSLALPWPATLTPGQHRLRGYARGAEEPIVRVTWSADRRATWQDAELLSPSERYAWVEFAFTWDATPGDHALMTRAYDAAGDSQMLDQPFNNGGYVYAMVHPHPVSVA